MKLYHFILNEKRLDKERFSINIADSDMSIEKRSLFAFFSLVLKSNGMNTIFWKEKIK